MTVRDGARTYAALALWFVVLAGAFFLMLEEDKKPEPHPDPFLWLMLAVLLLGWIPTVWVLLRETEVWRKRVVGDFLDSTDFEHRDPPAVRRDYEASDDYTLKRQRDHLWYGDHSELNWRDREQAQAWGMDADTYVSNWLEHDKD